MDKKIFSDAQLMVGFLYQRFHSCTPLIQYSKCALMDR